MKNMNYLFILVASLYLAFFPISLSAQITFTSKSTDDGLGSNSITSVFADGDNVYVGTQVGLSISTDNGDTFSNKTTAEGLAGDAIQDVFAEGDKVYATHGVNGVSTSTDGGNTFTTLSSINPFSMPFGVHASGDDIYVGTFASGLFISNDGGSTFVQKNEFDGMAGSTIWDVYAEGDNIYTAHFPGQGGISISNDGGSTFVFKTLADGLGSITAMDVFALGDEVYLATEGGLAISMDGGVTFINKTTTEGLAHNRVHGVIAEGDNVYAATDNGVSISNDNGQTFTSYLEGQAFYGIAYANGFLYAGGNMLYISTLEEETPESSWTVADIVTDCASDGATYDVCFTAADLGGVIGLDIGFTYPSQLTPVESDFITLKDLALNPVGGDASQIDVFENSTVEGEVSASVYFNSSAPLTAAWNGGGEFICFTFQMSETWDGMALTETITTTEIFESYETSVSAKGAEDATLEIITMIGQINVNGNESTPLVNGSAFNGTTEITTADENCTPDGRWTQGLNTATDGGFSIAAGGSANVRITRNTTENDLSVIGGSDAFRAVQIRLGLDDAPTLNELLAMDVNGDGFASAGDITNILRRSVGLITDYPTQAGEVASDWKFALSSGMDALEGGTYDWKTVPVLSQCMAVPADACADTVHYDAILKGDVVSSWSATSNFKTAAETSLVVDVASKHSLELEETYRIPVFAKDIESFFTLDLDLPFDATKVSIEDVVLTEIGESYEIQYVWNTPEAGRLMMASYTIQEIDTTEPLFEIIVKEDVTGEEFGTGTSYFNGIASNVEVIESTTVGIEDLLGGSQNLTAIQNIHPNPANSVVMLSYNKELIGDLQVQIMDLSGRIALQQVIENNGRAALELSALQNGLYIVTLSENGALKGRAKLMIAK